MTAPVEAFKSGQYKIACFWAFFRKALFICQLNTSRHGVSTGDFVFNYIIMGVSCEINVIGHSTSTTYVAEWLQSCHFIFFFHFNVWYVLEFSNRTISFYHPSSVVQYLQAIDFLFQAEC